MIEALLHRFTAEEYHLMAETGVLASDARVELLDGQIIDRLPIGPFHGSVVSRLTRKLNARSGDRWLTFPQCSLDLGTYYEPQPDLMLLRPREDEYEETLPMVQDVFVVIEVSDSSLLLDRTEKLRAYASAGIPEVWIVNVPDRIVEVYREPNESAYGEHVLAKARDTISPRDFPDVTFTAAEIFRNE